MHVRDTQMHTMKTIAILVSILAVSLSAAAQVTGTRSADTTRTPRLLLPETDLWLSRPTLFEHPSPVPDLSRFDLPPEFLEHDFTFPPSFTGGFVERRADLMSPLLLQWKSEERMRPFMIILGSISAGGAAYLAYEHIRKYGLFK